MARHQFLLFVLLSAAARHSAAVRKESEGSALEIEKEVSALPGQLTSKTISDLQAFLSYEKALTDPLAMNGVWDYRTQLGLQKFINKHGAKVSEDGSFGSSSIKGLQWFLNNNWEAAGSNGASKLWRDGSFGKKTVKALQTYLKTKEYLWKPTQAALSKLPLIPVTGKLDKTTVIALQRCLDKFKVLKDPLAITGEFDFRTQMAFQKYLNK